MKRLLVTSTDLMMVQFLLPHIINLSQNGFDIDIACSNVGGRLNEVRKVLSPYTTTIYEARLKRSPLSATNFIGYRDIKRIVSNNHYDLIWTNEPVMGLVTRLASRTTRKKGTKLLYMVHGFHFFKGAPKLNWIIYYPIEKMAAHFTDVICTVNTEDFSQAKAFSAPRVEYIHGIGINTERLSSKEARKDIREELNLKPTDFIVLSVGELNKNKNHKTIIKALGKLHNNQIHYIICGKGLEEENLRRLTQKEGIANNVHFLGYRRDVVDICSCANVYAMPSFREGLPVSSLEAMYCGLPLITSKTRGLVDVNQDGVNGFTCRCDDYSDFADKINTLYHNPALSKCMGKKNFDVVTPFTIANTKREVLQLLNSI